MIRKFALSVLFAIFLQISSPFKTMAATLSASTDLSQINVGQTATLAIIVDAQTDEIIGALAAIKYDPTIVDISLISGSQKYFTLPLYNADSLNGVVRSGGSIDISESPQTGSDTLAKLAITGKSAGTSDLAFECGKVNDSKITIIDPTNPFQSKDILDCNLLPKLTIQVQSTSPNPTLQSLSNLPGGPDQTCDACGKCVNQNPPSDYDQCLACKNKGDYNWTPVGCLPISQGGFTQSILRIIISVVGGLSFLAILYGGFLLLSSKGNPEGIQAGKDTIIKAIGGLILVLFSVFILQYIGVTIFNIPGLSGGG